MANTIDFNVGTNAVTVLNQTAEAAENTAKGFSSAKAELRALQQQLTQMDQTSEEFKKASARAAELKDSISDLSAEINANAGNAFEGVSNNISLFGSRLMSLDLKGAGQALTAVGAASKKIGFKEMATELGGLTKGIVSLGKALLTNPLFLLGSVIAMIVTNFDSLAKSGGAIGKILTYIGDIIDTAVKKFTDLTDAIGLTSVAAQKEAEKAAQAQADAAKFIDNRISEYDKKFADRKKKILEDYSGNISKAWKAEKEWAERNLENSKKVIKGLEETYNAQGYLDNAQTGSLRLKKAEVEGLTKYIKDFSKEAADYSKAQADEAKKAQDEKEKILEANAIQAAKELKIEQDNEKQRLAEEQKAAQLRYEEQQKELARAEEQFQELQRLQSTAQENEINEAVLAAEKLQELAVGNGELELAIQEDLKTKIAEINKKYSDAEIEAAKKTEEEKLAAQQASQDLRLKQLSESFAALGALNDAFTKRGQEQSRKQFQIQKALNLASAVVDTYGGINRALNDKTMPSTTARIIQASIVGAMGLANVIKISKTEYGNASAPSGTSMSTSGGGGGTEAPSPANFAFLQNQPNQQQPPLQAYVVSGQVSSNLEAQQLIQNQSRLGG